MRTVISAVQKSEAGAPSLGQRFPRTAKLLKHALFDQVYRQGQRQFSGLMTVFFLRRSGDSNEALQVRGPRVGFTVGRVLGNSVVRNRIRRRMREAVRLNLHLLPDGVDVVINPKKVVLEAEFTKLKSEVERAFICVERKSRADRESVAPRVSSDEPARDQSQTSQA